MRHWLFVLNFHFSSLSNWRQTLVNSRTYVFAVLIRFSFYPPPPHTHTRYWAGGPRWEGPCHFLFARALPVFPDHVLVVCSRGWCLSPGLQPSECCSRGPTGMFVCAVFYYAIFFFNCHCGKTGMCHCSLLAAGVRKPNYHGSQCLVVVVQ